MENLRAGCIEFISTATNVNCTQQNLYNRNFQMRNMGAKSENLNPISHKYNHTPIIIHKPINFEDKIRMSSMRLFGIIFL